MAPDLPWLHANAKAGAQMAPAVTWIGHSTVMAQLGGLTLLTDPMFSQRASPVQFAGPRRHVPPGIALPELPHVDLVLVSHNHYDHLDAASVAALNRQPGGPPLFVVPLGLASWFAAQGIRNVVELDWWDSHRIATPRGETEVVLVPAQHWSSRGPRDAHAPPCGAALPCSRRTAICSLPATPATRATSATSARRFESRQTPEQGGGFDIALLPIGAYEPRWFMSVQHVNVEEALQIHDDLGAKRSLGVHWGTFELTDESLDEPPRKLAELRAARGMPEDSFFVMAIGETRKLAARAVAMKET